ncbi:MAG: type I methionyl aminopeptidase [Candidatus Methylacidiphilales bacterium]
MIPIKSPAEAEKMRCSCRVVRGILDEVVTRVAPGMTTRDIDQMAADLIRQAGARSAFLGYRKFPGNICISVNEEVVHGIGGPRRINYGDVVKLDIGIFLDGWVGDTATTVAVGIVDPAIERLLRTTEESLFCGIAQALPGNRLHDIGNAIYQRVAREGYSVVREFVGHGVGRKLHEEPQVPNYGKPGTGPKLKPGMVLAIEPMVNMGRADVRILADGWTVVTADGRPSAHFEHTVLITEDQPEILTMREISASR